ncbi:conserved Plasmodium protein, unknown function [Plasmodium relictum]|uniref:CCAAT-box DNA binding protein subunit B n=1 Tax=Plasmodium relictum TaxID=85471 RepID=A0A1J1HAY6_PLARL|nr:conserved Plasmodium protein, unknown function [Plasmodium relictum]CRH01759.1 conserved Plasmodium protein, unknown function [Plasmodium relictum]
MIFGKIEENKNIKENTAESCKSYYEDFVELRKKIILKEKEIIEKRKNSLKVGENPKNKLSYRSFDEFYKYRKNYEEYENKIKNEAWKLLNKASHRNNPCSEEQIKNDEKYSYIKFKTERQGTVKQLKEYFQKIQEEKIQKRKNSLCIKNTMKSPIKTNPKDNKVELKKKKETVLENNENEKKKCILDNSEKEKKKCILENNENEEKEYILENNENEEKKYILENKEKEQITETYNNNYTLKSKVAKGVINKDNDKNEIKKLNKRIENINAKEIELLYNLINEMKNSYESDEDYISNLIEELHNSNKRYMIDKILDLLKIFDDKISSNVLNKNLKGNNLNLEKKENIIDKTNYDEDFKETEEVLEKKKLNDEMYKSNKKYIKENKDSIKDKEQSEKINHMNNEMEFSDINKNNKKKEKTGIEDKKNKNEKLMNNSNTNSSDAQKKCIKEDSIHEDKLNNNYKNENFYINKNENNKEKINDSNVDIYNKEDKPNNKNIINDNKIEKDANYASKFEWFYSTMKDIYEDVNEYEENSNLNEEIKDYSSDDSENNDLFLWIKNRDVQNILNEKNNINEEDIIGE